METFSALLALCAGNSPVPVNSPHKGQWRGALMFTLICARIYDWVNNHEAGDLRRHLDHYDVSVMEFRVHTPVHWATTESDNGSRLCGTKPLSGPMMVYCEFYLWEHVSVKFWSNIKTVNLKMSSAEWWPFCSCLDVLTYCGLVTQYGVGDLGQH